MNAQDIKKNDKGQQIMQLRDIYTINMVPLPPGLDKDQWIVIDKAFTTLQEVVIATNVLPQYDFLQDPDRISLVTFFTKGQMASQNEHVEDPDHPHESLYCDQEHQLSIV